MGSRPLASVQSPIDRLLVEDLKGTDPEDAGPQFSHSSPKEGVFGLSVASPKEGIFGLLPHPRRAFGHFVVAAQPGGMPWLSSP